MAKILGINLGTTHSRAAVMKGGIPQVLENSEGQRSTPSVLAFNKTGDCFVGDAAARQSVTNARNTIHSVKRLMGRNFGEVQDEIKFIPYKVVRGQNDDALIEVELDGKPTQLSPAEISAYILCKLKLDAELMLGEQITEAVITVPSCFNDAQRQATKDAGRIAGLEVKHILNESTAAALAYSLDKKRNETIAVYDLGGGTFDISILEVGDGVVEVKSTNGDAKLGGDDIDQRVVEWIVGQFKKENGIDLSGNQTALRRLKEAAEQAKVELSAIKETEINLTSITADASGPKHLQMTLTRARFEQMIEDIIQRTVGPCKQALSDAGITPDHIDEVVLVGGQTRMPRVRSLVRELFGREPRKDVNTDEIVALGAAVQGGAQAGEVKDLLLLDVTPVSLGIETMGGVFTKLIDRNTTIPTRKSETFSTAAANQTSVEIKIYQGERPLARDNRLLGIFQLMGIPPAPRGVPQIEVTFDIDSSGILKIGAKDRATGKEQRVTISGRTGLSSQELPQIGKRLQAFDLGYRNSRGLAAPSTGPTAPVQKKPLDEREPARMNPAPPTPSPLRDRVPHFQERTVVREAAVNETHMRDGGKPVLRRVLKDQYELLAEVGRGGFGAVYKARDIHLDQFVAVKELILEDTSPLKDEAKVLSDLRHRNIVGFRQLFPDQGRWYMVMDFVEGANLAKLISTRSLYVGGAESSLRRMLLIAHQAADGLHCAHDHGIIHQDMKPANVMVDANGVARVSDFGLAKARQQSMNIGSPGGRDTIMISGKGFTPAYCSPEQATGDKLTRRTDTWSWGLCVLEMFAGQVTWTSGVLAREALAKYGATQERRKEIPVLPQRLNNLLARCFQEESQMRPDMAEIASSMTEIESAGTGNWFKRFLK